MGTEEGQDDNQNGTSPETQTAAGDASMTGISIDAQPGTIRYGQRLEPRLLRLPACF